MNASITRYKKALRKQLLCSGTAKKELLARFQKSLVEFQEEHPAPDMQTVYDAFGPPGEMAKTLMEGVPQRDVEKYRRRRRFLRLIAGILAAVLLLFMLYVFIVKQKPIVSDWEFHDQGSFSAEVNPEE